MSAENEKLVMEILMRGAGDRQDASGIVELMTEDVVWQTSVPTSPPVVGRDACRAEIERQNSFGSGGLPGSEVRNIASSDSVVFTERLDILDLIGKRVELNIVGVFEIRDGKVAAWREYFDMNSLAANSASMSAHWKRWRQGRIDSEEVTHICRAVRLDVLSR